MLKSGAVIVGGAVSSGISNLFFLTAASEFRKDLGSAVHKALVHKPVAFFDENHSAELITSLSDEVKDLASKVSGEGLAETVAAFLKMMGSYAMMMRTSTSLTLLMTSLGPVVVRYSIIDLFTQLRC